MKTRLYIPALLAAVVMLMLAACGNSRVESIVDALNRDLPVQVGADMTMQKLEYSAAKGVVEIPATLPASVVEQFTDIPDEERNAMGTALVQAWRMQGNGQLDELLDACGKSKTDIVVVLSDETGNVNTRFEIRAEALKN